MARQRCPTPDDADLLAALAAFEASERKFMGYVQRDDPTYIEDEDKRGALWELIIEDEQAPLLETLCTLKAGTVAGLQARARALLLWDHELAAQVAGTAPCEHWANQRMTVALLRDLLAMAA